MSLSSSRTSDDGQYGNLRRKIKQVAAMAIQEAAKSSKAGKSSTGKAEKSVSSKKTGK
jgi:hypothetical protein